MFCKSYAEAVAQARANATRSGKDWFVFADTSGNWRCERDRPGNIAGNIIVVAPVDPKGDQYWNMP